MVVMDGAFESGRWPVAVLMLLSSLLACGLFGGWWRRSDFAEPSKRQRRDGGSLRIADPDVCSALGLTLLFWSFGRVFGGIALKRRSRCSEDSLDVSR